MIARFCLNLRQRALSIGILSFGLLLSQTSLAAGKCEGIWKTEALNPEQIESEGLALSQDILKLIQASPGIGIQGEVSSLLSVRNAELSIEIDKAMTNLQNGTTVSDFQAKVSQVDTSIRGMNEGSLKIDLLLKSEGWRRFLTIEKLRAASIRHLIEKISVCRQSAHSCSADLMKSYADVQTLLRSQRDLSDRLSTERKVLEIAVANLNQSLPQRELLEAEAAIGSTNRVFSAYEVLLTSYFQAVETSLNEHSQQQYRLKEADILLRIIGKKGAPTEKIFEDARNLEIERQARAEKELQERERQAREQAEHQTRMKFEADERRDKIKREKEAARMAHEAELARKAMAEQAEQAEALRVEANAKKAQIEEIAYRRRSQLRHKKVRPEVVTAMSGEGEALDRSIHALLVQSDFKLKDFEVEYIQAHFPVVFTLGSKGGLALLLQMAMERRNYPKLDDQTEWTPSHLLRLWELLSLDIKRTEASRDPQFIENIHRNNEVIINNYFMSGRHKNRTEIIQIRSYFRQLTQEHFPQPK